MKPAVYQQLTALVCVAVMLGSSSVFCRDRQETGYHGYRSHQKYLQDRVRNPLYNVYPLQRSYQTYDPRALGHTGRLVDRADKNGGRTAAYEGRAPSYHGHVHGNVHKPAAGTSYQKKNDQRRHEKKVYQHIHKAPVRVQQPRVYKRKSNKQQKPNRYQSSYHNDHKNKFIHGTHGQAIAKNDPCLRREQGNYILRGDFQRFFRKGDRSCQFVKCANHKAELNDCGLGTKNNKQGTGIGKNDFCNYYDHYNACSHIFEKYKKRKQRANNY